MGNNKRTGKFYRKNEKEVMEQLGFTPVPGSGSGWISKEDGENEYALCQLKSTDANSIKINKLDIDKLEYHSMVSHKIPVFAIQFLQTEDIYLLIKPENLQEVQKLILGQQPDISTKNFLGIDMEAPRGPGGNENQPAKKVLVKSGSRGQKDFRKSEELKYKKKKRSAI